MRSRGCGRGQRRIAELGKLDVVEPVTEMSWERGYLARAVHTGRRPRSHR